MRQNSYFEFELLVTVDFFDYKIYGNKIITYLCIYPHVLRDKNSFVCTYVRAHINSYHLQRFYEYFIHRKLKMFKVLSRRKFLISTTIRH